MNVEKSFLKVAPLDDYRLILKVDEHRIADLEIGQVGEIVLTALPNQSFEIEVISITPETEALDGQNTFRVEAQLTTEASKLTLAELRPGMEGVAKVEIGERHLIAIWTQSLRDWMRLFIWRWLP